MLHCNSEARLCRLPQLTAAIELVTEISRQLNERKMEAVAEITRTFEELERALHQRKTALVTEMENICGTKQKVARARRLSVVFQRRPPRLVSGFRFLRLTASCRSICLSAGPAGPAGLAPAGQGAHPEQLQLHGAGAQPRQRHRGGTQGFQFMGKHANETNVCEGSHWSRWSQCRRVEWRHLSWSFWYISHEVFQSRNSVHNNNRKKDSKMANK